jgi:hypothetical protein
MLREENIPYLENDIKLIKAMKNILMYEASVKQFIEEYYNDLR